MPRGFVWGQYHSDNGNTYAIKVDADYFTDFQRGWTTPATPGTTVYPREWVPRRVLGLDELGHPRHTVIATTSAPLWTGQATKFLFRANDGTPHFANVIGSRTERRSQTPH